MRGRARRHQRWDEAPGRLCSFAVSTRRSHPRRFVGVPLLAAALAVAWFARASTFGFIYDDYWTILDNTWLDQPLSELVAGMADGGLVDRLPDATRPSMVISMWIDWRLFGEGAVGYHVHSLLLYGLVCGLAACALFALSRRRRVTLIGAVFFAVAAVHAEVAATINYREDLLAAVGILAPLAALFWPGGQKHRTLWATLIAAVWLYGLLAKESAVALLALVPAIALLLRRRWTWLLRREATLFGLAASLVLWLNWRLAMRVGGEPLPTSPYPNLSDRLLATAQFEVLSLFHGLFPVFWSPEHLRPAQSSWVWVVILLLAVVVILRLARRRSTRTCAVGLSVTLIASLPNCPLLGPANYWADRYAFVSVLGGALVWGWAGQRATGKLPRRWRTPVLVLLLFPLLVPSQRALGAFRDELTLWTTAVRRAPDSPRSWHGLAHAYRLRGDLDASAKALERCLEIRPGYVPAQVSQVYLHLARGDTAQARRELEALRLSGASGARGVRKAERCARESREGARRCIEDW